MNAGPTTLAIDIGGTGLKAALLDEGGHMLGARRRIDTPHPCPPQVLVSDLMKLANGLAGYSRVSVGFPGVVREGRVLTAPHFRGGDWAGYPLATTLAERLGHPVRLLNDAEVQGLGIVKGRGLEVVLTLGTGLGSAVFSDGALSPHLELAHHPLRKGRTYNDYVGEAARSKLSHKKWNRRLRRVIDTVQALLHYDVLYLGGGNSRAIDQVLPDNVVLASNDAGLTGGVRLWDPAVWNAVPGRSAHSGFA